MTVSLFHNGAGCPWLIMPAMFQTQGQPATK